MACSGTDTEPEPSPVHHPWDQLTSSDIGPECRLVYVWGEINYTIYHFDCEGKDVWTATCNNDTAPGCTPPVLPNDVAPTR